MPRYISRDELIYLIQNNFVIKAGKYFNKTKMMDTTTAKSMICMNYQK